MSHLGATLCYEICISDLRSAAAVGAVFYSRSEGRFPFGVSAGLAKAVRWPLVSARGVPWVWPRCCGHAHPWAVAGDSEGLYCPWFVPCQLGMGLWRDLLTWLSSFGSEKNNPTHMSV